MSVDTIPGETKGLLKVYQNLYSIIKPSDNPVQFLEMFKEDLAKAGIDQAKGLTWLKIKAAKELRFLLEEI